MFLFDTRSTKIAATVAKGSERGGRIMLEEISNIRVHRGSNGDKITHHKLMSHLGNSNNNNNNSSVRGTFMQRHCRLILLTTSIRSLPIHAKGAGRQVITVNTNSKNSGIVNRV
jgi:hypothetical protein